MYRRISSRLFLGAFLIWTCVFALQQVNATEATGCCGNNDCSVLDGYLVPCGGSTSLCHENFPKCCFDGTAGLCCPECPQEGE